MRRVASAVVSPRLRIDVGAVFVYLALGAMFAAVPRYVTEQLDGSRALAGFAVSVFFVAAVLARPLAGRFVDTRGRRPLLAVLPFVIAGGTLGLLAADSVPAVVALRFVQGLAGGSLYVAAVTAETDLAPPDRRASAVARLSIAIYLGFALGPALGESLVDVGTAWTWLALAALAGVGGVLLATVPETRPASSSPAPVADDARPGRRRGARSVRRHRPTQVQRALPDGAELARLAPAGVTGELAVGDGDRAPLIHPVAVLPGLMLAGLGVGYASVTALSALYARSIGLGSSTALYVAFAGSILVVRLGSGRLADRIGNLRVMYPGLAAMASGFTVVALWGAPVPAVVGVALVGLGWALVFPATISWVSGRVPDAQRGSALGTLVALMDVGQGTGGYLVGAVADAAGFGWAYLVPAVLAAAGAGVLALAVRRGEPHALVAAPGPRQEAPGHRAVR